ncbi:MAG TPA: DUF1508 domain-containing protein [Candidatus Pacearchaeota archaeon]|nr:DUF1508 domain-containing protein [Candidatus Pacearchaeota archaeon]
MIPRFEIFKDRRGKWRFRLRAENGKIILASESYYSSRNALNGIRAIQSCAPEAIIVREE